MSLRFIGLHAKSLRSYKRALLNFFQWLDEEEHPIPKRHSILDDLLSQYFEHLWLDDVNITYAGHVLSAFRRFYPRLRFKLPVARQFFSNWKSVHVPKQAVPMPAEIAMAVAGVAVEVKDYKMGLLVLLGFTLFLRTSEITNLLVSQVQLPNRSNHIGIASHQNFQAKAGECGCNR